MDSWSVACFADAVERVAHKSRSFREARDWELEQYRQMTVEERREVARALRLRYFGKNPPDVRSAVAGVRKTRRT